MEQDIRKLLQEPPDDVLDVVASTMGNAVRVGCTDYRDGAEAYISNDIAPETASNLAEVLAGHLRLTPSEHSRVQSELRQQLAEMISSQDGMYFYLPVAIERKITEDVRPSAKEFLQSLAPKIRVKGQAKP